MVAWGRWGAAELKIVERQKELCPRSSGQGPATAQSYTEGGLVRCWRIPLYCGEDKALAQAVMQGEEFPSQGTMKGLSGWCGWSCSLCRAEGD